MLLDGFFPERRLKYPPVSAGLVRFQASPAAESCLKRDKKKTISKMFDMRRHNSHEILPPDLVLEKEHNQYGRYLVIRGSRSMRTFCVSQFPPAGVADWSLQRHFIHIGC